MAAAKREGFFQRIRESLQSGADTISTITSDGRMTGMRIDGVDAPALRKDAARAEARPKPAAAEPVSPAAAAEPAGPGPPPDAGEDPVEAAEGRSLSLRSVRDFRWAGGARYLSENLLFLLDETVSRFAVGGGVVYAMSVDDFLATVLAEDASVETMFIGQMREWARETSTVSRADTPPRKPDFAAGEIDEDRVILRWDMVDVLAKASQLRRFVNPGHDEIGTRNFAIALLQCPAGQAALATAGLLGYGFPAIKRRFTELVHKSDFAGLGDSREKWLEVATDLLEQALLVSLRVETGVSYSSDRAQRVSSDSLGIREDAAALSRLILQESAEPPMAIGLFGAWGSGKSTLIKELQHRIHEDLKLERDLARAGWNDTDPETRKVGNVVQIEFNAWAYADSANLWASLTSEIFDQLAVGGIQPEGGETHATRSYAGLVRDVKLLSSRDATALRTSDDQISDLHRRMAVAREKLRSAEQDRETTLYQAAFQTAHNLLESDPGQGPRVVNVRFGEPERPRDKRALEVVRDALSAGENPEARIRAYAESGGEIARWLRIVWDFAKARWWTLLVLALAGLLAATAFVLVPAWPEAVAALGNRMLELVRWLGAGVGVAGFVAFLAGILPAIRVAALFSREVRQRREKAADAEAQARATVTDLGATLEAAEATRQDAAARMLKFGGLAEGANAVSPELMFEFLMSDSADVGALRQQLGLIARVRRCFEQLNAVIDQMRKSGKGENSIDRIVLYIDDLDRCDAAQVSEVLQAVHLLLAFECFVVVVAVDARWLKLSLETHHSQLKHAHLKPPTEPDGRDKPAPEPDGDDEPDPATEAGQPPADPGGAPAINGGAAEADDEPPATAADYLEKIFQIPLWVRPMVDEDAPTGKPYAGYEKFVEAMIRPPAAAKAGAGAGQAPALETAAQGGAAPQSGSGNEFVWTGPGRPSQADKPRRQGLRLHDDELKLLQAMGPLAAKSPRAVKKMINLYRLLRVRYTDENLDDFLADGKPGVPSYRELLFALACENGLSAETRTKIRESISGIANPGPNPWLPSALKPLSTDREYRLIEKVAPHVGALTEAGMFTSTEEVRRFSFLP